MEQKNAKLVSQKRADPHALRENIWIQTLFKKKSSTKMNEYNFAAEVKPYTKNQLLFQSSLPYTYYSNEALLPNDALLLDGTLLPDGVIWQAPVQG